MAPGQFLLDLDFDDVPRYTLAKFVPSASGEGTWKIEPAGELLGYVRLTPALEICEILKFKGLSYTCFRRLCIAGFVDYCELVPGCFFISLDSLLAHLRATEDSRNLGETWWTPARLSRWRDTHGLA